MRNYYQEICEAHDRDSAARRYITEHSPTIEPYGKKRQAAIRMYDESVEFVQAHSYWVRLDGWGPCPVSLGVTRETTNTPNGAWKRWRAFDWKTGTFLAAGKTKSEAIHNAVLRLHKYGQDAYEKAIQSIMDKYTDGKRLN